MLRAWLRSRFPTGLDLDDVIQEAYLRVFKAHDKKENKASRGKPSTSSLAASGNGVFGIAIFLIKVNVPKSYI